MKASKFFMLAALAGAAVFTSCNNDDEVTNNDPVAVQFSAAIDGQVVANGAPQTRAAGTTWAANDPIGIVMAIHNQIAYDQLFRNNAKYTTKTGNGIFNPAEGEEPITIPDGQTVDFYAYYPWRDDADFNTPMDIAIGTAQTEGSQPGFDFLFAKANNNGSGYTQSDGNTIPLVFEHMLSKLVMNVQAGEGVSPISNLSVTIKGMYTKNKFDMTTGTWGTAETKANITPRAITPDASYDAIILPQAYAAGDVTVEFAMEGDTYTWNVGEMTFAPKHKYTYTVTLQKSGGATSVSVNGTINPWIPGTGGNVTAEPE